MSEIPSSAEPGAHEPYSPQLERGASAVSWPVVIVAVILAALAGGMGWGIRGQYGHETGAMMPGLLVALVLALLYCPFANSLLTARAVAMTAVAFGFGGAMTYGQTLGLTQDAKIRELGLDTYWWGLLGCFIKGGLWIGMAGAFLGMGFSGKRYHPLEMMTLLFALLGLMFLGMGLLNEPFRPQADPPRLPVIYFSDFWGKELPDWKPRREMWGGFLFVWSGLVLYAGVVKRDILARNMALIGAVSGGLGFSIGQSVQAYHHWHAVPEFVANNENLMKWWELINWWNAMEITFGLILGFGLALGLHLNRRRIGINDRDDEEVVLSPGHEWTLFVLQVAALVTWTFYAYRWFDAVGDLAITMGMIPLIGIVGGRYWPYLLSFPVLALPIAGKTVREVVLRHAEYPPVEGWVYWFVLPMMVMLLAGLVFARAGSQGQSGTTFARRGLLLAVWFYFVLNHVVFRFPWPFRYPWSPDDEPTGRTPSAGVFVVCAVVLTIGALVCGRGVRRPLPAPSLGSPGPSPGEPSVPSGDR